MAEIAPLVSQPTKEQVRRFAASTAEERFAWWVGMLEMLYEAADEKTRNSWRRHREGRRR